MTSWWEEGGERDELHVALLFNVATLGQDNYSFVLGNVVVGCYDRPLQTQACWNHLVNWTICWLSLFLWGGGGGGGGGSVGRVGVICTPCGLCAEGWLISGKSCERIVGRMSHQYVSACVECLYCIGCPSDIVTWFLTMSELVE